MARVWPFGLVLGVRFNNSKMLTSVRIRGHSSVT